ncbi:MAG: hypothetical protein BGP25_03335 [Lysobacterales bacterium 63-13]|nr:MAG: hypothetical protein BGP25_03335 [Xanthomonadales bacterium 63-13]
MAEINITPLVDVLLTVLIIFMVTTPLLTRSIPFPLASGEPGKIEPLTLDLAIRDTGELVLDGQSTSRRGLDQQLQVAAARGVPIQLDIRPEPHSSYDNLANVLAIAQNNRISGLRVVAPQGE